MTKKVALFVGRFQPFHKGHLSVVKEIIAQYDKLIIGIGSAEDNFLPDNPFSAGERYEMILAVLEAENIDMSKVAIIPVRNINNYALWVRHVELLLPKFDIVYTGSSIVRKLFEADGKYQIKDIQKELDINATKIRQKMFEGGDWEPSVPNAVVEKIKEINGEERIRKIA